MNEHGRVPPPPPPTYPDYAVPPRKSGLAIASLAMGLLNFWMVPLIGAITAIVLGRLAKKEIEASSGALTGDDMARVGRILGYIGIPVSLIMIGFYVVWFGYFFTKVVPEFEKAATRQPPVVGGVCPQVETYQARAEQLPPQPLEAFGFDELVRPPAGASAFPVRTGGLELMLPRKGERAEEWRAVLTDLGFSEVVDAGWSRGPQFIRIEVIGLRNHPDALEFQRWANGLSCPYSNEAFDIPGVPGSVGVQIRWSRGFTTEQVSFVRGRFRFLVISGNGTNSPPPREDLITAARFLDASIAKATSTNRG